MDEKLRILIVDDEPDIPAVLRPLLEPDFEVLTASNGLDALLKLPRYEPDLLIVDLMMPLMDGWELAERVRKHPEFGQTPMIFLTALDSSETIRKGYAAGANVYLTKPFDPARVLRNIQVFAERDRITPRPKQYTAAVLQLEEIAAFTSMTTAVSRPAPAAGAGDDSSSQPRPTRSTDASSIVRKIGTPPPPKSTRTVRARTIAGADAVESESELAAQIPPVQARFSSPPRILIVDDDEEILDILRLSLRRGFEVVTARNGLEALTKIPEAQPDVYIVDIMMPKMSGLQLLQLIRQSVDTRTDPVIMLSAKSTSRDRTYARMLGADAYIIKPFLASEIVAELERQIFKPGFVLRHPKRTSLELIEREGDADMEEAITREKNRAVRQTDLVVDLFLRQHGHEDPFGARPLPR